MKDYLVKITARVSIMPTSRYAAAISDVRGEESEKKKEKPVLLQIPWLQSPAPESNTPRSPFHEDAAPDSKEQTILVPYSHMAHSCLNHLHLHCPLPPPISPSAP
jgi:hypothetical protein